MIRISLGNVGSGKTANEVREMYLNKTKRKTYSNIITKLKHQININPNMIVKKLQIGSKKKRGANEETPIFDYKLNLEFWQELTDPINVVIDEAHSIINSRRAMSKTNVIVTDWLALIRRILGQSESGYGELVFITQLPNRIDIIAREMATQIRYHVCHYKKYCKTCNGVWQEHSEIPEPLWTCPNCNSSDIKKYGHLIEIWHFKNMETYLLWKNEEIKSYYRHYLVKDIENYFPLYNTLQWDNLFSDLY